MKYYLLLVLISVLSVLYLNYKDIEECEKKHSAEVCFATLNP